MKTTHLSLSYAQLAQNTKQLSKDCKLGVYSEVIYRGGRSQLGEESRNVSYEGCFWLEAWNSCHVRSTHTHTHDVKTHCIIALHYCSIILNNRLLQIHWEEHMHQLHIYTHSAQSFYFVLVNMNQKKSMYLKALDMSLKNWSAEMHSDTINNSSSGYKRCWGKKLHLVLLWKTLAFGFQNSFRELHH